MKKFYLFLISCLAILLFWEASACARGRGRVFVAEPILVPQPAYAGMRFYVFRPYDMPRGWYVTFDGFPVYRNRDGVWVYGTFAGPNLIRTHYVVGSVVPTAAGLIPFANPVQISSMSTSPPQMAAQPRSIIRGDLPPYSTYMPDWLFNSRFMAIGRWRESVDRIGVLHRTNTVVAWSGNFPRLIYAWNGSSWHQMMAREGERPVSVLRRNLHTITRQVRRNNFTLYRADLPILSQQAGLWGYYWMGEIMVH